MKTAVEWLQAEFNKWAEGKVFIPQDILENAKEMEKEQIIDAHTNGHNDCYEYNFLKNSANEISIRNGEDYYNETYKAK